MNVRKLSSVVTCLLVFLNAATSACAQQKSTRMIAGPSDRELVVELPNPKEDGISKIIIGELFKVGKTEFKRTGAAGLKDAPPLPTGYSLFKDLAFDVRTEATVSGYHVTVFSLPSVENESDFNKLGVLHLELDELSPAGFSWSEVMVFSGGWGDHFHPVSKTQYEALVPDFKSRRISAITTQLGLFVIASFQELEPRSADPVTKMELTITSSPEPAAIGQDVAHVITVENKGPNTADINLRYELNTKYEYVSSTTNRGTCRRSNLSYGRVLCHLGTVPSGAPVHITIVARVRANITLVAEKTEVGNVLEVVFKERPTDPVEAKNQLFKEYNATILRRH